MALSVADSAINFRQVCFGWSKQNTLFNRIDLTLPTNKIIVLTGENGSGKSTFASLATGLIQPTSGYISWNKVSFSAKQNYKIYHALAYLQQKTENNLLGVDAESDLNLWMLSNSVMPAQAGILNKTLLDWGLVAIKHRPVWELSAGELKRLCLAGISPNPNKYWVLDEPEVSLDAESCEKLISMLKIKRQKGLGALLLTNNVSLYQDLYDELWNITPIGAIAQLQLGNHPASS